MKLFKNHIKPVVCVPVLLLFSVMSCVADPGAWYFDPGATHEMFGVNRFPTEQKDWTIDMHLSPFYQHASGARNKHGKKVPTGDRLGRWRMMPLLWGSLDNFTGISAENQLGLSLAQPPDDRPFNATNYPMLYKLVQEMKNQEIFPNTLCKSLDTYGAWSVDIDYEKIGMRFELDIAMAAGFGFTLKGGVVDYKQTATFICFTPTENPCANCPSVSDPDKFKEFHDFVVTPTVRDQVFRELCLLTDCDCTHRHQSTAFEDTFAQLYWSNRFKFNDENGEHVVTVAPYVGAGVWIPTGKKKRDDRLFSMPTGHDGFWGVTFEGALNFDFPETVLINVGGSLTFFETKTLCSFRVPNQRCQAGIYPWKTKIRKTFGPAWNLNFSIVGKDIIDNLSVYFDYLYSKHERDTISIKDCDSSVAEAFCPKILEEDSLWRSQMIQLGFNYEITPDLSFGVCGQTHISGVRVYKTHTIMGIVTFTF